MIEAPLALLPMRAAAAAAFDSSEADARQLDIFGAIDAPVLAAWGAGVDSTAMLIEMIENGERVDQVLFADTGSEKPQTYEFVKLFSAWLAARGIAFAVVRYVARNFKNFPAYRTLDENCFTNGTVPSVVFNFGSCSQKWKIGPQNKFAESWEPAQRIWAAGGKVIKLIGYDCSPADQKRYAEREGYTDARYTYRYPLREWGWTRDDCKRRILRAGLPVPVKSACFMCTASKPAELHDLPAWQLRRIVLMEARAAPRLRNVDGLWRKPIKGLRGATPRPGSMTEYIRSAGLLPAEEIETIRASAPAELVAFQSAAAGQPLEQRPELASWMRLFDLRDSGALDADQGDARRFYADEIAEAA